MAVEATESGFLTRPRPWQTGQSAKCWDSIEPRMRWRVISRRPKGEMGAVVDLARSRLSLSWNRCSICLRCDAKRMSIMSHTTSPPMSRRRSWRQIASTASRFV